MTDTLALLGSALTIIAALTKAVHWLMKRNFALSQQTLQAKKDLYQERFENLKLTIGQLEIKLAKAEKALEDNSSRVTKATVALETAKQEMVSYISNSEKKLESFQSEVVKLSKDLILIRNKKGSE